MSAKAPTNPFATLTWDDVEAWAGSSIVSRGKGYRSRVQQLARTASGGLIAWVQGTQRYATRVEINKKQLTASCTCPYFATCKHAVAAILVYLECLKNQKAVPVAGENDLRIRHLEEAAEAAAAVRKQWEAQEYDAEEDETYDEDENDYDDDYDDEEEDDEQDDEEEDEEPTRHLRTTSRQSQPPVSDGATAYLKQQSKEELITLLTELMRQHPDVRQAIVDRANLLSGKAKKLVTVVRKEIRTLASQPGWDDDDWGPGSSDNYNRIRTHMDALLAAGHADEVLSLGQELLKAGTQQVEMINDEGETQGEVASCMNIVFRALTQSSLSPSERMLWAIDAELSDGYDLCQGKEEFWQQSFSAADWNIVADHLATRLQKFASENSGERSLSSYRRDHLSDLLIRALEQAGRKAEIIPLCEHEAQKTHSYVRLVNHLKQAKRWPEAEQWMHKGIEATRKQLPGIAAQLRRALLERREQEKQWLQVAAFYAEDFFDHPGASTLSGLLKAAKRAGVEADVRAGAFHYLETGALPGTTKPTKKKDSTPPWPLPECEVKGLEERRDTTAPMINALIDIAIDEKRPAEVLRWYDQQEPRKMPTWGYGWRDDDDRIASALVDTYPDRAIAMWKKMVDAQLRFSEVRAYETAATYLRKIHSASKKHRHDQKWQTYLVALRQANRRRPRLVEILDSLTGKPIVEL